MTKIAYSEAVRQAMREEMIRDKDVFLVGEDVGRWGNLFGTSRGLLNELGPEQVKDFPISEAALAGCSVGAAVMGQKPICEIMYMDFITIAMDQMVNAAVKYRQLSNGRIKMQMVFRTEQGVGMRNSSQHSASYENWFVNVPGLITVMPSNPADMKGLLKSAIRNENPVLVIEHKALYLTKGEVPDDEDYLVPLGKADVKHKGKDITVIATSWMVTHALEAAAQLAKEGISVEVVDPRTLWPLDKETIIKSLEKTGRCLVVTEAPAEGGWSAEAMAVVTENANEALKVPPSRLCGLRTGIPYSAIIERQCVPGVESIKEKIKEIVGI